MQFIRPIKVGLVSAVCFAAAVPMGGCSRPGGQGGKVEAAGKSPTTAMIAAATAVTVQPVVTKDIQKTVDVTGSLVALQDVVVGAKSAGKLAAVYLHEGDSVTAGQVVALMDTADYQNQVLQQQANLQAAITREQQARASLLQAQNQLTTAANAVVNADTTLKWTDETTKTAVQTAQAALESAKENLSVVKQGARDQERRQAEEAVASAKANYEKAKSDLSRYRKLIGEGAVSASQLDQVQATYDAALAAYNSQKQALSLIQEGARPQDLRRAELGVQQAHEALAKAQADRAQVAMKREDLRSARASVDTAKAGIQSAQSGVAAAKAGVDQARAAVRLAQNALGDAYVRSPITGFVAERRAEPGQQLGSGAAIMRIVSPRSVYFQAVLSESQYNDVKFGQRATIRVDALPGKTFPGTVTRILPVASASARSFTVRIDFPADNRLRPQMFARGSILIDTHRGAVVVPKDAVVFDPNENKTRVFTAEAAAGTDSKSNVAKQRFVKVGYTDPQYVEILSGLKPGDKVVTAGQSGLQDGDKIKVQ